MSQEPVFICGLGRSGTSWLANSLAQSEQLVYLRETWLLQRLKELGDWHDQLYCEWTGFTPWHEHGFDQTSFQQHLGRFYRGMLNEMAGGGRILEKTPEWNILYFDTLRRLFPDAYFVFIYRDGRNYVASSEAKADRDGKPFDFERCCRKWAKAMEIIAALPQSAPNAKRHVIRYEDLIESFDAEFEQLCHFIDIPAFNPRAYQPNSSFHNATAAADFNNRWKDWSSEKRACFRQQAGRQLVEARYELSADSW